MYKVTHARESGGGVLSLGTGPQRRHCYSVLPKAGKYSYVSEKCSRLGVVQHLYLISTLKFSLLTSRLQRSVFNFGGRRAQLCLAIHCNIVIVYVRANLGCHPWRKTDPCIRVSYFSSRPVFSTLLQQINTHAS